jgi:hypothetical protein
LTDGESRDIVSGGDDLTGGLVSQYERLSHDVVADPAVLVVVHVRAAHADGGNEDQDLPRSRLRYRSFLEGHVVYGSQYRRMHRVHRRLLAGVTGPT